MQAFLITSTCNALLVYCVYMILCDADAFMHKWIFWFLFLLLLFLWNDTIYISYWAWRCRAGLIAFQPDIFSWALIDATIRRNIFFLLHRKDRWFLNLVIGRNRGLLPTATLGCDNFLVQRLFGFNLGGISFLNLVV